MLLRLAWRNIQRNRRRSIIVLVSILVGVVALMFTDALSYGWIQQMLNNQIGLHDAHIQIHRKGFNDNRVVQKYIPDPERVVDALDGQSGIRAWSSRMLSFGLLSSAMSSSGGIIIGVEADQEGEITSIREAIVEGTYLSGNTREALIGRKLAEKLHVDIGDRVVGMASDLHGDIGSELFRVTGIFETVNSNFDKSHIFISMSSAQRMLEMEEKVMEYAVILDRIDDVDQVAAELRQVLGDEYEVLTYKELLPILVAQVEMYHTMMYIIYAIVGLAMIFGIINTMLMSVFERIREFGVLKAIGMKGGRIFSMVMTEACYLAIVGTAAGLLLGILITWPLSVVGINFAMFAESLASYGSGAIIYPQLSLDGMLGLAIIIPCTTMAGALYPAWKAMRLQPVSAIRHV